MSGNENYASLSSIGMISHLRFLQLQHNMCYVREGFYVVMKNFVTSISFIKIRLNFCI